MHCFACVVLRVLLTMNQPLFLPQFHPLSRENAAHPWQRRAFIQTRVACDIHSYWRFSRGPIFEPADAPSGACFHQSTLCENALAALYAGVVYPLHPLAGVDSARPLLFSGNAISYMSNRRTQSTLKDPNCLAMFLCSTASLLYPCRVARVSRLIGNSDSTAKAHHWQGGSPEGSGRPYSHKSIT